MRTLTKFIFLFFIPSLLWSQVENVVKLNDSSFLETRIKLTQNPDYKVLYNQADNENFASPIFDDSDWSPYPLYSSGLIFNQIPILKAGEVAWFRIRIKTDANFRETVVFRIRQSGASEVYLDGKLLLKLGHVGHNVDDMEFRDPWKTFFDLPLQPGQTHLLAIRYRHDPPTFPILVNFDNYFFLGLNSFKNMTSINRIKNPVQVTDAQTLAIYNIVLGLSLLLFIIFLSYYLFFPKERINGYFSLANFFLLLFVVGIIINIKTELGYRMPIIMAFCVAIMISWLIHLYCIYRIFNVSIDVWFKATCVLAALTIIGFIFYFPELLTPVWAVFMYFVIIRVSYRAYSFNKLASSLFIGSSVLSLLFWLVFILGSSKLLTISIVGYEAFVFLINPVVLAIYLGYAFGKRSQQLRSTLERVQKLSLEKESILSEQNETLEQMVKERTNSLNQSLEDLKNTQAQLIQSEKMASLGELTAGIAHEIQNPLNFVNNFSEVSNELIDEMNEELDKGDLEEAKAISKDVKQNLEKITHHGKRADAIVKGMLQHSRSDAADKEPTNINRLTDEFMRLAYHGLRAKDKSFNAHLETDFDDSIGKINLVQQDIGRVILNLFTNAFYAVAEKQQEHKSKGDLDYKPTVSAITSQTKTEVILKVMDNGNGITKAIVDKIFEPFFTTKPAGKGTGLGLSMSYDIIKAHGGELIVNSKEGEFTEFEIHLPKK